MEPVGYAALGHQDVRVNYSSLLTKGRFGYRFTIEIYRKDQLKYGAKSGAVFAIYFKDPARHLQVRTWVEEDGALDHVFETFDGASIALAVPLM